MQERGGAKAVVLVILGVVAVLAVAGAAVLVLRDDGGGEASDPPAETPDEAGARRAATAFVDAVNEGQPGGGGTVHPAAEVDAEFLVALEGLGEVTLTAAVDEVRVEGDEATAQLMADWTIGGTMWTSTGTLALERGTAEATGSEGWRARWSLAALDSRLGPGDLLSAERIMPERGTVIDGAGASLFERTSVVTVGIEPRRVTDLAVLTADLARLLDVDAAELTARVEAAAEDAFVQVITLREADYAPLRDQLQPLPGAVFRREEQDLARARDFARPLLGRVVPATEEAIAASEGRLRPGDLTGDGGVQETYDERLGGTPGLVVRVTRAAAERSDEGDPSGTGPPDSGTDEPDDGAAEPDDGAAAPLVEDLEEVPAVPGQDVVTTLDVAVQEAAEAALSDEGRLSSLVAMRVSTGDVLAVANRNGGAFDYGSRAEVPPGSTFKVVSTLALLRRGVTPDQTVPCPATAEVGGRSFKNAGDFELGEVPFRTDFAHSCNTAFVALSSQLEPNDLAEAGAAFGLGGEWGLGIPSFTGSVPVTEGPVDAAASTIGQGRLLASPLSFGGVAATVAAGRWKAPTFVVDPPVAEVPAEVPLGPGEAETLRALMAAVVTEGSGAALQGVPGPPVAAKTGTAEFGEEDPPRAHAWIIGYQADVAFAVFVEGGESGSDVAGPLAARFLTTLNGG
jgi:cell division protein FtsI/penicillin-binding protein 2